MRKNVVRAALTVLAVAFIVFGILRREPDLVLSKGRAICFACIGLG